MLKVMATLQFSSTATTTALNGICVQSNKIESEKNVNNDNGNAVFIRWQLLKYLWQCFYFYQLKYTQTVPSRKLKFFILLKFENAPFLFWNFFIEILHRIRNKIGKLNIDYKRPLSAAYFIVNKPYIPFIFEWISHLIRGKQWFW